jgi:hypothetical protein
MKISPYLDIGNGSRYNNGRWAGDSNDAFWQREPPNFRARSSAAERSAHNRLVVGSNPTEPTSAPEHFISQPVTHEQPELLQLRD